jgi:hypothetical protein
VQISAYNMGLISRIRIKGIAGYHWHCSCDYHSFILIVIHKAHKAPETNWFNDFQDTDTIMKLNFIEVGNKHYIITSCCSYVKCERLSLCVVVYLGLCKYTL